MAENDTRTFEFSKEDQDFLQPRQVLINQFRLIVGDIDFVMQQYLLTKVFPRLSIDPAKYDISYNVSDNKVTCIPKPPEIIKPDDKIVVPK